MYFNIFLHLLFWKIDPKFLHLILKLILIVTDGTSKEVTST